MPKRREPWRPPPGREAEAEAAFDLYITAAFLLVEMGCPEEVLRGVVSRAFTLAA